jgi:hypothetical protein
MAIIPIPLIMSVRGILFISLFLIGLGIFFVVLSSKKKEQYEKRTGEIEYFDKTYLNLPLRDLGSYRYLKINTYPHIFEVYTANADKTSLPIDDLKHGDKIDVYFYEWGSDQNEGINRNIQFIDKDSLPYFKRGNFKKQLGYVFVAISALLNLLSFILWKKRKLAW